MTIDIKTLETLGSRHSCPTLNFRLREYVDGYRATGKSGDYRGLLRVLRSHIAVRWIDSILAISTLTEISDNRIHEDVIRALGNFYHESSVSVLLDMFCRSPRQESRKAILDIVRHQKERCPEAKGAVLDALSYGCDYSDELRVFYSDIWL